jgi:hypothetical protein
MNNETLTKTVCRKVRRKNTPKVSWDIVLELLANNTAAYLEIRKALKSAVAQAEDRARGELQKNPELYPSWELVPGLAVRELKGDAAQVWHALNGEGQHNELTQEGFLACCSAQLRPVEQWVAGAFGLEQESATNWVNLKLGDAELLSARLNKPSIREARARSGGLTLN